MSNLPKNSPELLQKIRTLVITGLFSDDHLLDKLVLKGGNLLDLVYQVSNRTSVDVDFSISGDFEESVDDLRDRLFKALNRTFADEQLVVFDLHVLPKPKNLTDDMQDFWGGYQIDFKIIEQERFNSLRHRMEDLRRNAIGVGRRGSTKFCIDISKHEFCDDKLPYQLANFTIYVYSRETFVCEKIRAVCQQSEEYARFVKKQRSARARDFVDLHSILGAFEVDFSSSEFRTLIRNVFNAKKVPLHLIDAIRGDREFHRPDFVAVQATVKADQKLQDFDFYFDFVCSKCDQLESFWDV